MTKTEQTKAALLNAARSGAERPELDTRTGECLRQYIDPNSTDFDPDFVDDLRTIDPDWMVSPHRDFMLS